MAVKNTDPYTKSNSTVSSKVTTYDSLGNALPGTQSGYTYSFGNGADTYDFTATGKITANWQQISGGNGSDSIRGSTYNDIIWGDSVNNSSTADNGADSLFGGNGNDQIHGGNGADLLQGDLGADVIWGDRGGDTFRYVLVSDSVANLGAWDNTQGDVIVDFNAAEGDRIDLGALALSGSGGSKLTWSSTDTGSAHHVWTSGGIVYADTNGDSTADIAIKVIGTVGSNSFKGVNHDPSAAATKSVTTDEDTASTAIAIGATDSDSDALTYAVKSGAEPAKGSVSFDQTLGTFVYTPSLNQNGTDSFTIVITDGYGGVTEQVVSVTINAINDAPVVANAIADQSVDEDNAWSFTVPSNTFSDVDSATLTLSATLGDGSALPSWLTFNASTGAFSGTPPQDYNGAIDLKVTASDGSLSVSDTFTLTVNAVNDPAVITGTATGAVTEDSGSTRWAPTCSPPIRMRVRTMSGTLRSPRTRTAPLARSMAPSRSPRPACGATRLTTTTPRLLR